MRVWLRVHYLSYGMGDPIWFRNFFDNVYYHLENQNWGSVYPITMNCLYDKLEVSVEDLPKLSEELKEIKERFSKIDVKDIIWYIMDDIVPCPYLNNLAEDIGTLADFWITNDGVRNMFDVMQKAINRGINDKDKLWVEYEEIDKNAFTVIVRCNNDTNEDSE